MGTVLHPVKQIPRTTDILRFSPLLDGDGVASCRGTIHRSHEAHVSVPFSMGTVLHHRKTIRQARRNFRFSPLLDGDGVASIPTPRPRLRIISFQSPSR